MKKQATKVTPEIIKLIKEENKLREDIEKLVQQMHDKNTRRHNIKEELKALNADSYARLIRSNVETSWKEMIGAAFDNAGKPLRVKHLSEKIKQLFPLLTEKLIKQTLSHKIFHMKNNGELIVLRKPDDAGDYYAPADFSKSKIAGYTRVR